MPILTLKFKDNILKVYNFDKDKSITIGRRDHNDVIISNLTVSGSHAKIDRVGDGYLLTDLKSKNKTFVNDEEIVSARLKDNDVIVIGKHTLIFNLDDSEMVEKFSSKVMDQTMAMNSDEHRDLMSRTEDHLTKELRQPVFCFIEGGQGNIELKRNRIRIGKDSSSDIVIKGIMVGKAVAVLNKTPQGYSISECKSFTKIKINNKVLKGSALLEEFDMVKIGPCEFQFVYK
jgi:pSer/pThr/pTyr-binding forkhead associated (FHA) protein